jgi:hypothetical protein
VLLAAGVIALAGCTGRTAYASPSGVAAASPTPRQTQAVPSRPAPPSSPPPAGSASPSAPAPHSDLEALLPDFANRKVLTKDTPTLEQLAGNEQTRSFVAALLTTTGRTNADLDLAAASNDDVAITAVRVAGVPVHQLEKAVVDALHRAMANGVETTADVDGRPVRRLRFPNPGTSTTADQYVLTDGDVAFIVSASGENAALVQRTIREMFAPKLQDVLPAEIDGAPLERLSFPAEIVSGGGDTCSFVCQNEMPALAKQLGVGLDKIDMAIAYSEQPPGVAIIAILVAGVAPDRVLDARIASMSASGPPLPVRREMKLGGKSATYALYSVLPTPTTQEFLYANGDTLFLIRAGFDRNESMLDKVPPIAEKAIAALP